VVTRYGGEEFAIIFPGRRIEDCREVGEAARVAIAAASHPFEGLELQVTASGGLAQWLRDEDVESLVKRADDALYYSKAAGRDCGHWHDGQEIRPLAVPPEEPAVAPADISELQADAAEQTTAVETSPSSDKSRDALTGLHWKAAFYENAQRRVAEWKRGGTPAAVVLAKIDDYDKILQDYGRDGCDLILRAAAQFLKATTREMDHLARFDESEFAMLLPGADLPGVISVAERLRKAVARCRLPLKNGEMKFTLSLGAAEPVQGDDLDSLVNRARLSLNTAMRNGQNTCYVHDGRGCEQADAFTAPTS
jgi:diguanylate cyclase (GGDEF)-like protein